MDDVVATLERRAERGVTRGADAVLRNAYAVIDHDHVALVDASVPPQPRRRPLIVAAVVVVLLVGAATWKLTTGEDEHNRVVTTPTTERNATAADRFSLRLVTATSSPPCAPGTVPGAGPLACFELGSAIVGGDEVANAYVGRGLENSWDVLIDLTTNGLRIFNMTAVRAAPGTKLAVVVDGIVRSAPVLQATDYVGSITISDPSLTETEARDLAASIKATGPPGPATTLRDACDYLTPDDLERLGVSRSSRPDDPSGCSYVGEAATAGAPVPTLGIKLRRRSEPTDTLPRSNGNFVSQEVPGLGARAAWLTLNGSMGPPAVPGQVTSTTTAPSEAPPPTNGQLIVKPPGLLLDVFASGMHDNLEEAKLAAQILLSRL